MTKLLSDICKGCGLCCKCMVLPVIKPLHKSVMEEWINARGCEILKEDNVGVYVKINMPCPHLTKSDEGYTCDDYENRPAGCAMFDGRNYDFLGCSWKALPSEELTKAGIECPFCKRPGIRMRRYKMEHLWITEYRCSNGHIFQKES